MLSFEEYAPLTRNRVRLMVDVKKPGHSQAFYQALEKVFRDNGLPDSVYMISDRPEPRAYFKGEIFAWPWPPPSSSGNARKGGYRATLFPL